MILGLYHRSPHRGVDGRGGQPLRGGDEPRLHLPRSLGHFVYVANYTSNNVSVYSIDAASGALTRVAGSPFPAGANPRAITADPSGVLTWPTPPATCPSLASTEAPVP